MDQKWAILILVHAEDAKTKYFSKIFIDELQQTNDAEHLRMFVLRNTYNASLDMNAVLSEFIFDNTKQKKELQLIHEYGKINLGDPNILSDIFDNVKSLLSEKHRFIVVTWDHGFAFGIFNGNIGNQVFDFEKNSDQNHLVVTNLKSGLKRLREEKSNDKSLDTVIEEFKSNNFINEKLSEYSTAFLKELALSDDTDMLTPEEISLAIKNSALKKIDVLIMMNCWMQSVETCYALQNTVEIIIAAESTIDFIGYDYIDFINKICSNPEISSHDLSVRVIDKIKGKYKKLNTEIAFKEIAVSAIDLLEINELKTTVDNLSDKLGIAIRTDLDDVSKIRKSTYELTHAYLPHAGILFYYFVDIFDVMARFNSIHLIAPKDFNDLKIWFDKFLLSNTIGGNFTNNTLGLSIYFPNNKGYIQSSTYYYKFYYPKGPKKSRKKFALDSSWANFIDDYNQRL